MLKILPAPDLATKYAILSEFKTDSQTWVVADLHSKSHVQTELLARTKCLPEDAVLRVSELWRKILSCSFVDLEVASTQLVSTLLSEWLKKRDLKWAQHPGTSGLLLKYIGEFLPAYVDIESSGRIREWLRENPEALMRWGNWYELGAEAWDYFCQQKILASTWVSSYLAGKNWSGTAWSRDLFFDVGPDLESVEIDILRKLGTEHEVNVFVPDDMWRTQYPTTLWMYDFLAPKAAIHNAEEYTEAVGKNIICRRFTTQIAEVKSATAQIRKWLDAGELPHNIGLLSADIENYWPALQAYMQFEGVPLAKDTVTPAMALPEVTRWISRLKIESHDVEPGVLEASLFASDSEAPLNYDRFQQLFSRIYDERDLTRDRRIREAFHFDYRETELLTRDVFLNWAIKYWLGDIAGLERIASQFLLECPVHTQMELRSWLNYLSGLVAKVEIILKEGDVAGVICANFDAAQNMKLTNAIFLGLSEESLRESLDLSVSSMDVQKIAQDLGIHLAAPDRDYGAFLAKKIASQVDRESQFYFSATDFSGRPQAPSLLWLQTALSRQQNIERFHVPESARWDELQFVPFKAQPDSGLEVNVRRDLGLEMPENFVPAKEIYYSASQFEKYLQCPFRFSAEKVFHLSDLPDVDLDVDAMTSGRVLHATLEKLLEEPLRLEHRTEEIERLVDEIRTQLALPLGDERLWPAKRSHFVRIAQNFLAFEKEWRIQFSQTQTVGREVPIRGRWEVVPGKAISVRGQIDRVDARGDHHEYVLLDYKSSGFQLHNANRWLESDELQLAFYAMAVEDGLTDLPKGPVIGAFYYTLGDMKREKGFRLKESGSEMFETQVRNRSAISAEDWRSLGAEIRKKIATIVARIENGELFASPRDKNECQSCHWSTLCRAPHLN